MKKLVSAAVCSMILAGSLGLAGCGAYDQPSPDPIQGEDATAEPSQSGPTYQEVLAQGHVLLQGSLDGFTEGTATSAFYEDDLLLAYPESWPCEMGLDDDSATLMPLVGGWVKIQTGTDQLEGTTPQDQFESALAMQVAQSKDNSAGETTQVASSNGVTALRAPVVLRSGDELCKGFYEMVFQGDDVHGVLAVIPEAVYDNENNEQMLLAVLDSICVVEDN